MAVGQSNTGQFFAYKSLNNDVTLYDTAPAPYYLELSNFNSWSVNTKSEQMIAEIPFVRNLIQLEGNSKNQNVVIIDGYLHYFGTTSETLDFPALIKIFQACSKNKAASIQATDHYLKTILNITNAMVFSKSSLIDETDLSQKITLGIFIRLFMERFLYKTIIDNKLALPANQKNKYCWTSSLLKACLTKLNDDQKAHCYEAQVISPSILHANSFMYEPLIDVGGRPLVNCSLWLISENAKWPIV